MNRVSLLPGSAQNKQAMMTSALLQKTSLNEIKSAIRKIKRGLKREIKNLFDQTNPAITINDEGSRAKSDKRQKKSSRRSKRRNSRFSSSSSDESLQ
jgi:hypothetical protein